MAEWIEMKDKRQCLLHGAPVVLLLIISSSVTVCGLIIAIMWPWGRSCGTGRRGAAQRANVLMSAGSRDRDTGDNRKSHTGGGCCCWGVRTGPARRLCVSMTGLWMKMFISPVVERWQWNRARSSTVSVCARHLLRNIHIFNFSCSNN